MAPRLVLARRPLGPQRAACYTCRRHTPRCRRTPHTCRRHTPRCRRTPQPGPRRADKCHQREKIATPGFCPRFMFSGRRPIWHHARGRSLAVGSRVLWLRRKHHVAMVRASPQCLPRISMRRRDSHSTTHVDRCAVRTRTPAQDTPAQAQGVQPAHANSASPRRRFCPPSPRRSSPRATRR